MNCQEVINGALRKLGKLGAGREPRAVETADALESLKGLYRSLINSGAFGRLADVVPTTDYTAGENQRIFRNSEATIEITLPELVDDVYPSGFFPPYGARWIPPGQGVSNQRPPRDLSVVVIADAISGETQEWLYDGSVRRWIGVYDLNEADTAPLAHRDPDGLKAALAVQMADEFGGEIGAATARLASLFQTNLTSRWSMPRREQYGVYC